MILFNNILAVVTGKYVRAACPRLAERPLPARRHPERKSSLPRPCPLPWQAGSPLQSRRVCPLLLGWFPAVLAVSSARGQPGAGAAGAPGQERDREGLGAAACPSSSELSGRLSCLLKPPTTYKQQKSSKCLLVTAIALSDFCQRLMNFNFF